jgi:fructoselysine 3-epimerase
MYPVNLASDEPWLLELSRRSMRDSIQVAADPGPPMVLVTTGRGYENQPTVSAWSRAVESLGALADIAAREGLTLLLEPLQRNESNLVTTAEELERMLGDIGRVNVQVVLDTVAMAMAGDSVEDYVSLFGQRIRHVHLVDGKPNGHLAWGDGELPLTDYVHFLERSGYAGQYTFELFGNYANDPRNAIERCLNRAVASGVGR